MTLRSKATVATFAALLCVGLATPALGQVAKDATETWEPTRLADGQPDIQGMWNNIGVSDTPLELPDGFSGPSFSQADLEAIAKARATAQAEAAARRADQPREPSVGAYAAYWFDSYWNEEADGLAPAIVVEPLNGQVPDWTSNAHEVLRHTRQHLHDSWEYMESGDRCITRGVIGMMMPTVYNNGTLILQSPGYVVLHSEMIHSARIIPIDGSSHVEPRLRQWDGDPRGRWEGNTLVVESTNFRAVRSMRGPKPNIRSRQSEEQRLIERFTFVDQETIAYSAHVDDPATYNGPWTAAFPLKRDSEYQQFEYACHEGNYSVPNALSGARAEERSHR